MQLADRIFIVDKGSFSVYIIAIRLLLNHSPSEWFSYIQKTPRYKIGAFYIDSAFGVDLVTAFGTGNHDFPFAFRHTAYCAAVGAGEIFMLFIAAALLCLPDSFCNRVKDMIHKPCIFRPPFLQITREHTVDCPNQHDGSNRPENNEDSVIFQEHGYYIQNNGRKQHGRSQIIAAVAAVHESG